MLAPNLGPTCRCRLKILPNGFSAGILCRGKPQIFEIWFRIISYQGTSSPGLFVREGSDMSQPTIGANIIRDLDLPPSVRRSDLTRRNSDVANPVESK